MGSPPGPSSTPALGVSPLLPLPADIGLGPVYFRSDLPPADLLKALAYPGPQCSVYWLVAVPTLGQCRLTSKSPIGTFVDSLPRSTLEPARASIRGDRYLRAPPLAA